MARTLLVLNGPNLDLLGLREPDVYGTATLADLTAELDAHAASRGIELHHVQSNHEGDLIEALHDARGTVDGVVLNAGGLTHCSVALRDAIAGIDVPVIETHISNVSAREEIRHRSVIAAACLGVISGFGSASYRLAIEALIGHLDEHDDGSGGGASRQPDAENGGCGSVRG